MRLLKIFDPGLVLVTALGAALMVALPMTLDLFGLLQVTVYAAMAILALSLALVWGVGGVLCFGQAAFFGIGGYTYAVAAINLGDSTLPIVLSILAPALFAAILGYFMFLGRLSELYVGVITLCVSLILFNLINSTSGPQYAIGAANLNGFNGMSNIPTFNMPFDPASILSPEQSFYLTAGSLIGVYLLCRLILASTYGRIVAAVRENETRAELFGYNAPLIRLSIFVVGAGIAGYAGCLFANWNGFISPDVFSLAMTAQTIIWIIVGGRETFIGPILGAFLIQHLSARLGSGSGLDANVVMGTILMGFVALAPRGAVWAAAAAFARLTGLLRRRHQTAASEEPRLEGEAARP